MADWKLRRGEQEWRVKDAGMLKEWVSQGKIESSDYVFNPILNKWMYATEVAEIRELFRPGTSYKGCQIALLLAGVPLVWFIFRTITPNDVWHNYFSSVNALALPILVLLLIASIVVGIAWMVKRVA